MVIAVGEQIIRIKEFFLGTICPKPTVGHISTVKDLAKHINESARGIVGPEPSTDLNSKHDKRVHIFSALATIEYIQTNVTSAKYSAEKISSSTQFVTPKAADEALSRKMGICGDHVSIFVGVMEALEIKVRTVQFWYESSPGIRVSHIAAEIYSNGGWRFYDVTWGTFYTSENGSSVLSIVDVLSDHKRKIHSNNLNGWFQNNLYAYGLSGVLEYLHKNPDITLDAEGTIHTCSIKSGNSFEISLQNIPNYVGSDRLDIVMPVLNTNLMCPPENIRSRLNCIVSVVIKPTICISMNIKLYLKTIRHSLLLNHLKLQKSK